MPVSSEANCVCWPSSRAAIWSADTPARIPSPSVLTGRAPVRNVAPARAWSPAPSPPGRPLTCAKPLRNVRCSRNGARPLPISLNSKFVPVPVGVHSPCRSMMPFGTYTKPMRSVGREAPSRGAAIAGTMASIKGSAIDTPMPRSTARRERAFCVKIMVADSSSETACFPSRLGSTPRNATPSVPLRVRSYAR